VRLSATPDARRVAVPLACSLASLLLHVLLLSHVLFGGLMSTQQRPSPFAGSGTTVSDPNLTMVATFLEDPEEPERPGGSSAAAAPRPPSSSITLARVSAPLLPEPGAIRFSDSDVGGDSIVRGLIESDPHRTAMLGRYMGQINARIERAWIRPRTSIESGQFTCRARITQAKSGAVLEIELQDCNGDGRWQASLAHAIESASPLPAPPDPDVFSRVVMLDFNASPFSPGADSTGFEPETRSAMN
jgi:hypothetical protein